MKKVIALILCLCLTAGLLAVPASAEEEQQSVREQVIEQAKMSYRRSRYTAGKESFAGYCGLMVSHQLYNLKINTWCITNDGNKQFDYYKDLPVTTGGYYPTAYGNNEYTLEQALNEISRYGTKDVFNILVGFQWTNTEAGHRYGHTVFINGILDGMCYFVESFDCSLNSYHPEGSVIVCSIADFVAYFSRWTVFDGVIHFGTGNYSDSCKTLGTDVTVMTRFDSQLRSQPCLVGENDCVRLRSVSAGERLRATAILTDRQGQRFYRIEDGGNTGYIAASAVCAQRVNPEDLNLENPVIPDHLRDMTDGNIGGTVVATNGGVGAVEVLVTDDDGQQLLRERADASGCRWDIGCLNEELYLDLLEPGLYTVEIYADCAQPIVVGGDIEICYSRIRLWGEVMQVGGSNRSGKAQPVLQKAVEQEYDGWVYENQKWYYYRYGKACTGWLELYGVDYYFGEDGAATTGWADIDGWTRYFTATGAMVTGWLTVDGVTTYRQEDGTAVTGWQSIGTGLYCFREDGSLVMSTELEKDGAVYVIAADGQATVKTEE